MNKWAINSFSLVLAVLAGSTAYFWTKSSALEDYLTRRDGASPVASASLTPSSTPSSLASSTSSTPVASPAPTASSTAPATLAASSRLASPTETYTVVAGDTLYPVSLKFNMSLERLAEANNLSDPYPLKVNQVLVIPEVNAKTNLFEVRFTTDPSRATLIEETVKSGSDTWRLDPKEVAKAENAAVFGLALSDDYRLSTRDDTAGTAFVIATRLVGSVTKNYEIHLIQPATKGATGIWSIARISPKAA
jgi:LysM repeat protein